MQLPYNDDKSDKLSVRPLPTLPGNDVPFLWCTDDDLGAGNLLLVQLVVSSQLTHCHAVGTETLEIREGELE